MAIKYLTPNGRSGTTYSFGGGGNTVEVDPNAAITDPNTSLYYGYTVYLGGGDDVATLGVGNDTVYGDLGSDTIAGGSGNDVLYGATATATTSRKLNTDTLYGDFSGSVSNTSTTLLGADTLKGASGSTNFTNYLYGDAATLTATAQGPADTLVGGDLANNFLHGDAATLTGNAKGGNDILIGGVGANNDLYGDAATLTGNAVGGNDTLTGGTGGDNNLYGDAASVNENALLGNDTLFGVSGASNIMAGDAGNIARSTNVAASGNDVLTGGSGVGTGNLMYGDATSLTASAGANNWAGNDSLTGGNDATNIIFGDAQTLLAGINSQVTGGNDVLFAGNGGTNTLYGDGQYWQGSIVGGTDTLVSGTGNDTMWGDVATAQGQDGNTLVGGADVFVFLANSGTDTIMDFRSSDGDKIDVSAWGVTSFGALSITNNGTNPTISYLGNTINVAGGTTLSATDFIFFTP